MVAVLGLVASVTAWHALVMAEEHTIAAHLELHATEYALAVNHSLEDALRATKEVAALFAGSEAVSPDDFRAVAHLTLAGQPGLWAVSWNPRVPSAQRAAHEAAARAQGLEGYRITEEAAGSLREASERAVHYVVRFIEPLSRHEAALGFDVGSEPRRLAALERAADTGEVSLTAGIDLVQDEEDLRGFLAFHPLYRRGAPLDSTSQRRESLEGFAVAVFRTAEIVETALRGLEEQMGLRVLDVTDPQASQELYARSSLDAEPGLLPRLEPGRLDTSFFERVSRFENGGRTWELRFSPSAGMLAAERTWAPLQGLLVGLLVTAGFTGYFALLAGRARHVEQLVAQRTRELHEARDRLEDRVAQRTAELAATNEDLAQEVDQRKRAESALSESEERLRLMLDAVSDGGWDWNFAREELLLSPEWYASLGLAPGDFQPTPAAVLELVHPEDRVRLLEFIGELLQNREQSYAYELRLRTPSGAWRWFLARGTVVERDAAGTPLRIVGAHTDITDRKRAEERQRRLEDKVRQSQKLESLGVLAGGIAHDFNNLLAGVLGNSDLALMRLQADEESRGYLEEIQLSAKRAAELTHQLLAYAGRTRFCIQRIDLSALAQEMTQLLRASVSRSSELHCDFGRELPAFQGDIGQIRQIAMNLITNASDALGDAGGIVSVRTGVCELGTEEMAAALASENGAPGRYVFLEVEDTGCGMDDATRARIFDPFFTTKFQGRGLGLAAVLGIVRGHGGAIQLESQPGRGTRFRVLFPCVEGSAPSAAAQPDERILEGHGTVLIVDDEPSVRKLARRILEQAGFRCLVAEDGRRALEVFERHADEIDGVLLDLTMPQMSGTEVMEALRQMRGDVRILATSGWAEESSLEVFAGEKPSGFLQKPYLPSELLAKLNAVLRA